MSAREKAVVLGAGSWGTTLAIHLAAGGRRVALWDGDAANLERIRAERTNAKYLPGIALHESVEVVSELAAALEGAALVTWAVPSVALREVARRVRPASAAGRARGLRHRRDSSRPPPASGRGA